jgi:hypothetical protein
VNAIYIERIVCSPGPSTGRPAFRCSNPRLREQIKRSLLVCTATFPKIVRRRILQHHSAVAPKHVLNSAHGCPYRTNLDLTPEEGAAHRLLIHLQSQEISGETPNNRTSDRMLEPNKVD